MELAVLADSREGFLLDGSGSEIDAVEDARVEDVDASVDAVAHELDWFLHEAVDARRVAWFVNNDAVFGGLLYFRNDDCSLVAVGFMEVG